MIENLVPNKVFFTKGAGFHKEKLQSFEAALRSAGIAYCNLVQVSSILPPKCKIITKNDGLKLLQPGGIIFSVMARNQTNEPNRLVASSVGLAVPSGKTEYGYLSEHHSFGENEKTAGDYAEDLAATMLATTLGIEFDPDVAYDKRKEVYRMSNRIIRTRSITQTATGKKQPFWTTVVAAAIFIL
ncbi:MAG: arginine decarboxylase, pyruvoyl-dependent [bacterium]